MDTPFSDGPSEGRQDDSTKKRKDDRKKAKNRRSLEDRKEKRWLQKSLSHYNMEGSQPDLSRDASSGDISVEIQFLNEEEQGWEEDHNPNSKGPCPQVSRPNLI